MRLGVVMPVVLQNEDMLKMTLETLRTVRIAKRSGPEEPGIDWSFHMLCNRLSVCSQADLLEKVKDALNAHDAHAPYLVEVINDRERTVAGAWNEGSRRALLKGAHRVLIMANDARPAPGTIETLAAFGQVPDHYDVALWTGCPEQLSQGDAYVTDGADLSLFMLRPRTLALHGYFDENYRPAYFEDNDYYARVVLGGEKCRVIHAARYKHLGSQTNLRDPDMAHHVRHWFPFNRDYFIRKWGRPPAATESEVKATYHPTPFNVPGRPLTWWELEEGRR